MTAVTTPTSAATDGSPTPPIPSPTDWRKAIIVATAALTAVFIVTLAFLWPPLTAEPRGIDVAVAGPPAATAPVTTQLSKAPVDLDVTTVGDRDALIEAIKHRDVFGGIVIGQTGPEVLVASAASPQVATALKGLAANIGGPTGATVTDVVPLSADDPNGTALGAAGFPLVLASVLGGVLCSLLVRGRSRRLGYVAGFAVAGGLLLSAVLGSWFGILPGSYWALAGALALAIAAGSGLVVGLNSLLGQAGIGVAALLLVLVGNPMSGAAMPWQFLPSPWGSVGQWFPPGASSTLLRDVAYFPDAPTGFPVTVLIVWALVGLALIVVGRKGDPVTSDIGA